MDVSSETLLQQYFPGGFYGFDRGGRPVFIEPTGRIDFVGICSSVSLDEIVEFKRKHCELAKEKCEEQEKKLGIELKTYSTLILDAEGGSTKHLWKPGLRAYQAILDMYEREFPNLRERVIIVNTSPIFPIIFMLLKPFMAQSTKRKIVVLGRNWKTEILQYVDEDNLPELYGGKCKDENGSPRCDKYICYGGEVPKCYYEKEKKENGK